MILGYVPGAWDMFHVGHLNILLRSQEYCDRLVVGVVTDDALLRAKGKYPVVPLGERMEVVSHFNMVDDVVVDYSSDNILFKGDDWQGTPKGDKLEVDMASVGVEVHYFPYTAMTSSTHLRTVLAQR
jgi:glycerol-3-phosphate cytidylyltransferase